MSLDIFTYTEPGIATAYLNEKWTVCIKNFRPKNSIENIARLEIHHETDQQYLLLRGNCSLAVAEPKDGILDVQVVRMEVGKVYNIRRETWFNTICEPGARMLYIQDANTTMENSELHELTPEEKVVLTEKYYC